MGFKFYSDPQKRREYCLDSLNLDCVMLMFEMGWPGRVWGRTVWWGVSA